MVLVEDFHVFPYRYCCCVFIIVPKTGAELGAKKKNNDCRAYYATRFIFLYFLYYYYYYYVGKRNVEILCTLDNRVNPLFLVSFPFPSPPATATSKVSPPPPPPDPAKAYGRRQQVETARFFFDFFFSPSRLSTFPSDTTAIRGYRAIIISFHTIKFAIIPLLLLVPSLPPPGSR